MDEDMEDPIVHEVDVFLSRSLASNLFVVQYPLYPQQTSLDDVHRFGARAKPKQKMLELQVSLNTDSNNYNNQKGEQIAKDVDGGDTLTNEEPHFPSGSMDRQVLRSVPSPVDADRFSVAVLKGDELHLSPIHAVVQMHPTFDYLDKTDCRQKAKAAAAEAAATGDSSQEEEEVEAVTVKFARPETAEAKARRMASYEYVQRQVEEEQWCSMPLYTLSDHHEVDREFTLMYSAHGDMKQQQFLSTSAQYLDALAPKLDDSEETKPAMPDNILTRQKLKQMPLTDAVRALLTNVKVMQFSKLMEMLPERTDPTAALRALQQVAVMVQGCWVVKRTVYQHIDKPFALHHTSWAVYLKMWKFTHCKYVVRKEVACGLSSEDVKDILEQMSTLRSSKGWEFVFDYDKKFVERHPEVVQRQRLLWDAKYQTLCQNFKLPKDADKKAREAEQLLMMQNSARPRRRRTSSRSSPRKRTLSGRSLSDMSDWDMEPDATGDRNNGFPLISPSETVTLEPVEMSGEGGLDLHYMNSIATNSHSSVDRNIDGKNSASEELKKELKLFAREALMKIPVIKFSELKQALSVKLSQVSKNHVFSLGVTEHMLQEAVRDAGAVQVNKPLNNGPLTDGVFVLLHQGNRMDKAREVLFSMLEFTSQVKSSSFISKVKETVGDEFSDAELKKLLRDVCESHNNTWFLKGTAPTS